MSEWTLLRDVLQSGSPVLLVAFLLFALMRDWLVLGKTHEERTKDRDFWRDLALRNMGIAGRVTEVTEQIVRQPSGFTSTDRARLRRLEQLLGDEDEPDPPPRRRKR